MWCMLDYLAAEREFKVGATDGFLDWKLHINESLESSSELDPLKKADWNYNILFLIFSE